MLKGLKKADCLSDEAFLNKAVEIILEKRAPISPPSDFTPEQRVRYLVTFSP